MKFHKDNFEGVEFYFQINVVLQFPLVALPDAISLVAVGDKDNKYFMRKLSEENKFLGQGFGFLGQEITLLGQ